MQQHFLVGYLLLSLGTLLSSVHSKTDPQDVLSTPKLNGWKANGSNPCGESWERSQCSGTSVTKIKLSNHGLNGQLGYQLSSLTSVRLYSDMSRNNLSGEIPYQLPPNAEYVDLSGNSFSGNVPYSISQMSNLRRITLGHNQLKGQLMDMFAKLTKLKNLHRTSQNLGMGYNAPECANPGAYTQNSDIYGFEVVMLELMTGRKPLDIKRPKSEECLVKWASPRLHDILS